MYFKILKIVVNRKYKISVVLFERYISKCPIVSETQTRHGRGNPGIYIDGQTNGLTDIVMYRTAITAEHMYRLCTVCTLYRSQYNLLCAAVTKP